MDSETGYQYFGARYYDSDLSVWLSVDPLSDKYPSQSPYSYVGNRPINVIDPNGMWEKDADGNWVAQKGDSPGSLARDAGISQSKAEEIIRNYNNENGNKRSSDIMVYKGDKVSLPGSGEESSSTSGGGIGSEPLDLGSLTQANENSTATTAGQSGGCDLNAGHINWFLGSTAGMLGGKHGINGALNNFKSLAAQYPSLNFGREIRLTQNISSGLKWFGRGSAAFSVGFSYFQYRSGQISGAKFGLDAAITGASFTPFIGLYIGAQYFVIDNTIGVDNFSNMMISQEIQRANMINSGNLGVGFYPHVGMGVR